MKIIGIIPSRYNSNRFPGKPLVDIMGKSMIQRVYEQAKKCKLLNKVIVATDDERISFHVKSFGGEVMMTSQSHKNGTERCGEVIKNIEEQYEITINIQGDQPFISPTHINHLINIFKESSDVQIASLATKFKDYETYIDENSVKVFFNEYNIATKFERKSELREKEFKRNIIHKHIGLYAFKTNILEKIIEFSHNLSDKHLNLEQLIWMKNNLYIHIGTTDHDSISIDHIEDLKRINMLQLKNN